MANNPCTRHNTFMGADLYRFHKCVFKSVSILIVLILICGQCFAQDISERYVSKTVGDDNVIFIKPHEINALKSNNLKKQLLADFTIPSQTDSVAFLFSIYSKEPIVLERIKIFCYDRIVFSSALEKMFVKTEKKLYVGRYRFMMSKTNFKTLYSVDYPYVIDISKDMKFSFKKRKWNKEKQIITDIIKLAEINQ